MRAQKDLRLLAALDPFFNFDGLVVTAIDNLDPGLAALYEAIPFLFNPPLGSFFTLPCCSSHYFNLLLFCLAEPIALDKDFEKFNASLAESKVT
jgi:hypothetical protein